MEDKLFDIFDNFNIEEASILLDKDFDVHIDKKIKKRIMNSVKIKSQLSFSNRENILDKLKNIFRSSLFNKRLAMVYTIFVLFLGSGGYAYTQIPVSYVSLDINPSIELTLNKFNRVVSYQAYNSDGENLLASNNKKYIYVDKAINNIISSAVAKNYISSSKNSAVAFATISNDSIARKELEIHLKDTIEKSFKNKFIDASVRSSNSDLAKREEAKSIGFTVSKLVLIQELKYLDSNVIVEQFKYTPIIEIENKILKLKNNVTNNGSQSNVNESDNTINKPSNNASKDATNVDNQSGSTNNSTNKSGKGKDNKSTNKSGKGKDNNLGYNRPDKDKDNNLAYNRPDKDKDNNLGYNRPDKDEDNNFGYNRPDKDEYNNFGYNHPNKDKDKILTHNRPNKDKDKILAYNRPNKDEDKILAYNRPNKNKYKNS
ncbi:anti-sigma-I factor RsgI family protein [Romboutsia sp.]|uniref:anti-sigma-I factor RsgI family protein n=1 Tax=Romboutsia sp. TaxID=1965302 RepID=UPI002B56DD17|nr:hypothetical protein [Romboutsia sp.]HSQ90424.1 hypothetical protein [Romboutsia sp.]